MQPGIAISASQNFWLLRFGRTIERGFESERTGRFARFIPALHLHRKSGLFLTPWLLDKLEIDA